jgi:hypothetical protein
LDNDADRILIDKLDGQGPRLGFRWQTFCCNPAQVPVRAGGKAAFGSSMVESIATRTLGNCAETKQRQRPSKTALGASVHKEKDFESKQIHPTKGQVRNGETNFRD